MYIHVSCDPGFYFTVFLFFLQVSMPGFLHEALPIFLYPMNKMHKRLVKFMCKSILGNIKSSLQYWGKYNTSISKFYIVVWFNSLIHHHCHCCVFWNQGFTLISIGQTDLMYRWNRSFNIPPPRAFPRHFTPFPAQEGGVLITTHRWWGIWPLATISWYELRWFPRRLINKSWRRRWRQTFDEFKGKYCVFVVDWLKTKGLQEHCSLFEGV